MKGIFWYIWETNADHRAAFIRPLSLVLVLLIILCLGCNNGNGNKIYLELHLNQNFGLDPGAIQKTATSVGFFEIAPVGTPLGPGGGGWPSGLLAADNGLWLAIDVGGVRHWSSMESKWYDRKLPTGTRHSDSIRAIAKHEKTLIAATLDGRIYRSENAGDSWELFYEQKTNGLRISSLYFDPGSNGATLYAGTGFINVRKDGADNQHTKDPGNGRIMRFKDITQSNLPEIFPLPNAEDDQPNVLAFRRYETLLFVTTDTGLYYANLPLETGASSIWTKDTLDTGNGPITNQNTRFLEPTQTDEGPLLLLTLDYDFEYPPQKDCAQDTDWNGQILYRKPNEKKWTPATAGLTPSCTTEGTPLSRRMWHLTVDPKQPKLVYGCDNLWSGKLYHSTDGGISWKIFFNGQTVSPFTEKNPFQCQYLALTDTDVFVAGRNLGGVWQIDRSDPAIFTYLTGTGSPNDGWIANGESNFTLITKVKFNADRIFATLFDFGLMVGGKGDSPSWMVAARSKPSEEILNGLGTAIAFDPNNKKQVFYSAYSPRDGLVAPMIRMSADNGENWTTVASPIICQQQLSEMTQVQNLIVGAEWLFSLMTLSGKSVLMKIKVANIASCAWEIVNLPISDEPDESLLAIAKYQSTLFVVTSKGVYRTEFMEDLQWEKIGTSDDKNWNKALLTARSKDEVFLVSTIGEKEQFLIRVQAGKGAQLLKEDNSNNQPISVAGSEPTDITYQYGRLFVTSIRDGITAYSCNSRANCKVTPSTPPGLPTNDVRTIAFRRTNAGVEAYIGTGGHGLYRFPVSWSKQWPLTRRNTKK